MLFKCLCWGLVFNLLHVRPFSGENVNNRNTGQDDKTLLPSDASPTQNDKELILPEIAVKHDFNDSLTEKTSNPEINETLAIPNTGTQNDTDIDYELSNNDTSTEVVIETTTLPTTEVPTTVNPLYENELIVGDFCLCDLKVGFCDINCCCDEDCSADDRKVFSHCQMRPQDVLDTRYCYQKQIIFSNHTEYKVEYLQSGVFCIVTDNLPQRTTYIAVKGATTMEEYEQLEKDERHYPWESSYMVLQFEEVPYTAGSPVWAINEDGYLFNVGIPVSVIGSECEATESLYFLEDTFSSCIRVFQDVAEECETNINFSAINYLLFYVVADPSSLYQNSSTTESPEIPSPQSSTSTTSIDASETDETELPSLDESKNQSTREQSTAKFMKNVKQNGNQLMNIDSLNHMIQVQDLNNLSEEQLLSFKIFLCFIRNNEEECIETNLNDVPQPVYTSGVCENVTKSILYTFIHNGTEGIFDVKAKVYFTDVTNFETHIIQNFHAEYIWASTKDNIIFERSGRPGYIIGKPILLGKLVNNVTEEDEMKEAIYLDTDSKQWLTVLAPDREGKCNSRSQVTFGEEMRTGCIVQVRQEDFSHCQQLQHQFLELLLGPILRNTDGLRIATFGDSSVDNAADWIPILMPEEPRSGAFSGPGHILGISKCSDLILSVHIEIAFSQQGSLANPQAKVVGTVLHYGEPQSIEHTCIHFGCQITQLQNQTLAVELVSSVSFVEVTLPPQPAYSQPPALDAKLPYDFFYPFLPSAAPVLHGEFIPVWNILLLCCLFSIRFIEIHFFIFT